MWVMLKPKVTAQPIRNQQSAKSTSLFSVNKKYLPGSSVTTYRADPRQAWGNISCVCVNTDDSKEAYAPKS